MDKRLEEKIEESDRDDEGLTNEVYFTEDDTVIKIYSKYPLTSFYVAFIDVLALKFRYMTRSRRISNEIEVKKEVKAAGLNAPEIIYESGEILEFEMLEGVSGYNYLESCEAEQAQKFGEKVGEFLPVLHSRGVALKDFRVSNMIVGDEIALIDHEYSAVDANRVLKWFDYLTLFSSIRQTCRYVEFKTGFNEEAIVPKTALFASVVTSFAHALILEQSPGRLKKIIYSVKSDLNR